jgi:hypothetical protein
MLKINSRDNNWCADYRLMLASAISGRQWTQARCHAAGFAEHNKCLLCVHYISVETGCSIEEATLQAPIGNLTHRIWQCEATKHARNCHAPQDALALVNARHTANPLRFERALFPRAAVQVPPPNVDPTFSWVLRPQGGTFLGTVYSDGSRLDGPDPKLARNGWAFVVVNSEGAVIAKAQGVPPDWITDIPGTEAWAILQAASLLSLDAIFVLIVSLALMPSTGARVGPLLGTDLLQGSSI